MHAIRNWSIVTAVLAPLMLSCMFEELDPLPTYELVHDIINEKNPCKKDQLGQLKTIITHYPDAVDAVDRHDLPALHAAVKKGRLDIVRLLIEHGADYQKKDQFGRIAFSLTESNTDGYLIRAYLNLVDAFYQALDNYVSLETFAHNYLTTQAAFKAVKALLGLNQKKIQSKDEKKNLYTLFANHYRQWIGIQKNTLFGVLADTDLDEPEKIAMLSEILSAFPDGLHAKNICGVTPLHYAFWRGYTQIMFFLLDEGADINEVDSDGATILHWAAYADMQDAAKILLKKGGCYNLNLDIRLPNEKNTALHLALARGNITIAKMLVKAGANPNLTDDTGMTALCLACKAKDFDLCSLLIAHGANPLISTNDNKTAYDFCLEHPKDVPLAKYIALVSDFYKVINSTDDFSTFATKHLQQKSSSQTISSLLPLDKKRVFVKKFARWCKKEKQSIYRPAQTTLGALMRKGKFLPRKTFFQKLSTLIAFAKK